MQYIWRHTLFRLALPVVNTPAGTKPGDTLDSTVVTFKTESRFADCDFTQTKKSLSAAGVVILLWARICRL